MRSSTSKIEIKAPAAKVWDAVTSPDLVRLWQHGSVLATTWVPETSIRFTTEWNGQRFEQWGKVIEFAPHSVLKYSLFAPRPDLTDRPENYFFMTYRLTERNGSTLLEIIQEDPRPRSASSPEPTEEDEGENPVLRMLKDLVEKA